MVYTQELKERVMAAYIDGATFLDIAKKFKVSKSTAQRWVSKGTEKKQSKTEERNKLIRQDRTEGASVWSLMSKYRLSEGTIRQICHGIILRDVETFKEKAVRLIEVRSKAEDVKEKIKIGDVITLEIKEGRKYYLLTLTVKQKTDSVLFGTSKNGRMESVQWSQFICGQVKLREDKRIML